MVVTMEVMAVTLVATGTTNRLLGVAIQIPQSVINRLAGFTKANPARNQSERHAAKFGVPFVMGNSQSSISGTIGVVLGAL